MRDVEDRQQRLAAELDVSLAGEVESALNELRDITRGIGLMGEVTDRTPARVMVAGELMATRIGTHFLTARGLPT